MYRRAEHRRTESNVKGLYWIAFNFSNNISKCVRASSIIICTHINRCRHFDMHFVRIATSLSLSLPDIHFYVMVGAGPHGKKTKTIPVLNFGSYKSFGSFRLFSLYCFVYNSIALHHSNNVNVLREKKTLKISTWH